MKELTALLSAMVARGASDLYLNAGAPPALKIEGQLQPLNAPPLEAGHCGELIYSCLSSEQVATFESLLELDLGISYPDIGRFRLNIYRHSGNPAMVVRYISERIATIDELGLPEIYHDLAMEERGLILVAGAADSGKSTSLAAMIDYRNRHRTGHILTIEDPIEFTHHHQKSLISQREVGVDTLSFAEALTHALRESPDVIVIGEIRDADTALQALRYAETGQLCLASLHASNASQAIDRLLSLFPLDQREQKRLELAHQLRAVVAQRLARGIDGRRVPAVELLINTAHIRALIEAGERDKLREAMSLNAGNACQCFDDALYHLAQHEQISRREELRLADSPVDLNVRFRRGNELKRATQSETLHVRHWLKPGCNFQGLNKVKLSAKRNSRERRPEMAQMLERALHQALRERGYEIVDANPDLIVRYAYGLRHRRDIDLDNSELERDCDELGLAAKCKLATSDEVIWYMTATELGHQSLPTQQELDVEMTRLFASLPFAGI